MDILINPSNMRDCVVGYDDQVPSFISKISIVESETNVQCVEFKSLEDSKKSSKGTVDEPHLDLGKFDTPLLECNNVESSDFAVFLNIIEKLTDDLRMLSLIIAKERKLADALKCENSENLKSEYHHLLTESPIFKSICWESPIH